MSGTAGLAAELGLALSNVFWDAFFVVIVLAGLCLLTCLLLTVLLVREGRRDRQRRVRVDDALDVFGGTSDAEIERHVSEWSRQQGGRNG